jgi:hypothetical protein
VNQALVIAQQQNIICFTIDRWQHNTLTVMLDRQSGDSATVLGRQILKELWAQDWPVENEGRGALCK